MSLESLKMLRRRGGVPGHVLVFVGDKPNAFEDGPDTVFVQSNPVAMDWRPVFGLHVDMIEVGNPAPDLLRKTIAVIDAATTCSGGLVCKKGVVGLDQKHEETLLKIWKIANANTQR